MYRSVKSDIRFRTAWTSDTTFLSSTMTEASFGAHNATWNTARFSDTLIFSPPNIALMRSPNPAAGNECSRGLEGIYLDYSKNRITDETLRLLFDLARQTGLGDRIGAMFRGEKINVSENRAVLHVALRAPPGTSVTFEGHNVVPEVSRRPEQDGRLCRAGPQRRLERTHRQAHSQRRQHRHRRLRSRPGDGL